MRSVTANTRRDGEEFIALAVEIGLRPTVSVRGFDDVATTLADLRHDRVTGAAVIDVGA